MEVSESEIRIFPLWEKIGKHSSSDLLLYNLKKNKARERRVVMDEKGGAIVDGKAHNVLYGKSKGGKWFLFVMIFFHIPLELEEKFSNE